MAFLRCMKQSSGGGSGDYSITAYTNITSSSGTAYAANFNLANVVPNYESLTVDNFIVQVKRTWTKAVSAGTAINLEYSYVPSTGVFSINSGGAYANAKQHIADFYVVTPALPETSTTSE